MAKESVQKIHIALNYIIAECSKEQRAANLRLRIEFAEAAGGKLVSSRPEIGIAVMEVSEKLKQDMKAKFPKDSISDASPAATYNLPRTF